MKKLLFSLIFAAITFAASAQTADTTLTGNVVSKDPHVTSITYNWSKVSGPAGGAISSPGSLITRVTGLTVGVYVFQIAGTPNVGPVATAQVTVTVYTPSKLVISAGPDMTIPTN